MELPLHPILNHFPVALVPVSIASDLLGRWTKRPTLGAAAWWTLCFAALFAPLTAFSGWYWLDERGDMDLAEMQIHRALGSALAMLIPLFAYWRWRIHSRAALPGAAYLSAGVLLVVAVGVQGYLGGKMAFGESAGASTHGHEATAPPHGDEGARSPHGQGDGEQPQGHEDGATQGQGGHEAANPALKAVVVPGPASRPSLIPRFATDGEGGIHLGWIAETASATGAKRVEFFVARRVAQNWTPAIHVAGGDDWFVNWADVPALAVLGERDLLASYLRRTGAETYDYRVEFVRSTDGGSSWSEPARLHDDAGPGEHGFVSLVAMGDGSCTAVWLDGRSAQSHGAGPGAMRLYARLIGANTALGPEILLDDRVCDCCPTSAVRMPDGAVLVAYRDRSDDELRDISLVRLSEGSAPETTWTSADGWEIAGCPVNGPALAASKERVGLAWFTLGADGVSRVLCALSDDGGKHFSKPRTLARQRAGGRVDAAFDAAGRLVVSWLESDERSAEWRVARIDRDGRVSETETAAMTTAGRDAGIARLVREGDKILFAFTDPGPPPCVTVRSLAWE